MREHKKYKYSAFGEHLRRLVRSKYGSIKTFSKLTGIKISDLYEYEIGRIFPPIEKFLIICKILEKTPSFMLLPLCNLSAEEKELVNMTMLIKDILKEEKIAPVLRIIIMAFEILYETRRHFKDDSDVISSLVHIKNKLFEEGQLKKVK
jgi:transcriptional regulator with XRE-family HTH domain